MNKLLDVIAMGEANKSSPYGEYGGMHAGITNAPDVSNMTIGQVKSFQRQQIAAGAKSSAAGRYQILHKSMDKYQKAAGLSDDDLFSPDNQNKMITSFISNRAGDDPEKIADVAAAEFASIKNRKGVGNYDGKLNKAKIDRSLVVNAAKEKQEFDPDAYLLSKGIKPDSQQAETDSFDPDAYLASKGVKPAPLQQTQVSSYENTANKDSVGENFVAGIGGGMYGMYLGAKDMLGLATDEEVKDHQGAMKGLNGTVGGFVGDMVGQTAVMLPMAGGALGAGVKYVPKIAQSAGSLAGRTGLAAVGGATQGAFIPTTEDDSRLGNMAIGAAAGAAGNQVLERGSQALQKFAMKRAATPPMNQDIKIQVDNYLINQGVDISQLSTKAQTKARDYAYKALQADVNPKAAVNQGLLDSLPVPMQGTKGQLGQDFLQQDNERVLADTWLGKPLRNRFEDQQGQLAKNLDVMVNRTNGQTNSIKDTGEELQGEVLKRYNAAKGKTKDAYTAAQDVAGDNLGKPSDNLVKWLDYNQGFKDVDGVITKAQKLGIIAKNDKGEIIAGNAPLRNFYEIRKDLSNLSKTNGSFAEPKKMLDDTFDAYGGDLYRTAAGLRRKQGVTFESGAKSVRDLVALRKGTTDQLINKEDVFNKVVINGNRDDIRNIKKLLLSGDRASKLAGARQLENFKKQTLSYIKDASVFDTNGKATFSLAQFEKAYKRIGPENLEEVLGKQSKAQLDDFMKAANIINRQQPRSAANSATAARLANMAGSIFKIMEKIPMGGGILASIGSRSLQAAQATGATSNQITKLTKKAIDLKTGKVAGQLSKSALGTTLKSLGVAGVENLNQ